MYVVPAPEIYPAYPEVAKPLKSPVAMTKKLWLIASVCFLFAFVLGMVALFVPAWSRIYARNGLTAVSAPSDSTLYVGLYRACLELDDKLDTVTCFNTDTDNFPTAGNSKCKTYFNMVKVFTPIGVGLCGVTLIVALVLVKKIDPRPPGIPLAKKGMPAAGAVLGLLTFGCFLTAFLCYTVVAEVSCGGTWNPIQGYSYSFICACCACGMALIGTAALILGMMKMPKNKFKKQKKTDPEIQYPVLDAFGAPVGAYSVPTPSVPAPVISSYTAYPNTNFAGTTMQPLPYAKAPAPYISSHAGPAAYSATTHFVAGPATSHTNPYPAGGYQGYGPKF